MHENLSLRPNLTQAGLYVTKIATATCRFINVNKQHISSVMKKTTLVSYPVGLHILSLGTSDSGFFNVLLIYIYPNGKIVFDKGAILTLGMKFLLRFCNCSVYTHTHVFVSKYDYNQGSRIRSKADDTLKWGPISR